LLPLPGRAATGCAGFKNAQKLTIYLCFKNFLGAIVAAGRQKLGQNFYTSELAQTLKSD
jgi:hypothetical protein